MSTKTLGTTGAIIGTAIGTTIGGPIGGAIGGAIGGYAGTALGNAVNGPKVLKGHTGGQLSNLAVQSSSYGKMLPVVYGCGRLAGNIIWAQDIKEVASVTQNNSGGGKGGGGQATTSSDTTFSYYITAAIAICEGPIDELMRIWADAKVINQADYNIRFYKGTESQMPDSLIESLQGVGMTPAYRGTAYVVVEDFPLADYGNRIPNFTFEVRRTVNVASSGEVPVEDLIKSMVLIPGAGEFVYDDIVQSKVPGEDVGGSWAQRGNISRINQNNRDGKADGLVALDQLAATCKNVEWVAPVVCWFGDDLDAGTCVIKPGVEYQTGATTQPDVWEVGSFTRSSARQITLIDESPQYGGTPSDASLLRYLTELKNRGYNIMFYPMFFMDVENKPWRGRVTGSSSDVAEFFTKTNGFNEFILHYADLVKDVVDAFVIGSELVGLTSVNDGSNVFPAVDELVALAASVKAIVGSEVKVTYAADWSEYHHTTGGWYNLDPLWASGNIDMVGIDAYFPLTDEEEPVAGFTQAQIMAGWEEGEGYDWYYSDEARCIKVNLDAKYAWKNIAWWWENEHVNPDLSTTAWEPESKKIWFTEYGFPSVDGCTNQPNVFYDPDSSESHFPYHSRGRVDFRAQRNALTVTENKWADSEMVERKFVWTWDARPFPFWPDLAGVWADGDLWRFGHWVEGKLGASSLAAIVADLSLRAGLAEEQIDVSALTDIVDGYILNGQGNVRGAIDDLRSAYFFDAVESGGVVKYVKRGNDAVIAIAENELVLNNGKTFETSRLQELELPQQVDVLYMNKIADYQTGNQNSQRLVVSSQGKETLALPIVMSNQFAKNVADTALFNAWNGRSSYEFILPIEYAYLEPTDVVTVTIDGVTHVIRVADTRLINPGALKVQGFAEDISIYNFYNEPGRIAPQTGVVTDPGDTVLVMLDLPALPADPSGQGYIRYAGCGVEDGWKGAVIFTSGDNGENYSQVVTVPTESVIGVAFDALGAGVTDIFDYANSVTVSLYGNGELESISELAVLNGGNFAKLGDELIQFKTATLVESNKYVLSGLLRGRLGTENTVASHALGEEFVLINNNLVKELEVNSSIGIAKLYKAVSVGKNIADTDFESFTYNANCLKPFAPVHIVGLRDGGDNLTISWVRRTRSDGSWRDYVDVPLGEASEQYEIDIMDGADVVRTISGISSSTASYSASEQTVDFGSVQSAVNIRVYQISEVVGRGNKGEAVV